MICSFFGHRSVPDGISDLLIKEIRGIIEFFGSDIVFYVGDKGQFDCIVQFSLVTIKEEYPEIEVNVVLDSVPVKKKNYFNLPTILPDIAENVPKRFAMNYRNKWMIDKCDIAVVYFTDVASNTRKHVDMLKRKVKTIINVADMMPQNLDNPLNLC